MGNQDRGRLWKTALYLGLVSEKSLARRLLPARVYVVMSVVCLVFGMWCWVGVDDQTPLERYRHVAVFFWVMMPVMAGLAVLSHRVRGRR